MFLSMKSCSSVGRAVSSHLSASERCNKSGHVAALDSAKTQLGHMEAGTSEKKVKLLKQYRIKPLDRVKAFMSHFAHKALFWTEAGFWGGVIGGGIGAACTDNFVTLGVGMAAGSGAGAAIGAPIGVYVGAKKAYYMTPKDKVELLIRKLDRKIVFKLLGSIPSICSIAVKYNRLNTFVKREGGEVLPSLADSFNNIQELKDWIQKEIISLTSRHDYSDTLAQKLDLLRKIESSIHSLNMRNQDISRLQRRREELVDDFETLGGNSEDL